MKKEVEQHSPGHAAITAWMAGQGMQPFPFQIQTWAHLCAGGNGIVNAPTGCGKTYSVFLGALIRFINTHPDTWQDTGNNGLQLLWITPLRALAKDIARAMEEVITGMNMRWRVGIRNGDTPVSERQKQKRNMPEILVITPESLHLMLAQKGYPELLRNLQVIAVDEWHELIGSKRGVQVELAISRTIGLRGTTNLCVWGISATIGNLKQAAEVLLHPVIATAKGKQEYPDTAIIKADLSKSIEVHSIFPDEIEKYPWAGHLGIRLAEKAIPVIETSKTTLLFINTRGMSETWYQTLLDKAPDLAGAIALHHGSVEQALRLWVEEALHTGILKAVVCTSSLDLGVDFRPVDTVIQVGSPKGVGRFLQRAGRSGHRPGEASKVYFLPTHSLELMEAAALKTSIAQDLIESREPMILCFDVLLQYLCTLAVSEGFRPRSFLRSVRPIASGI